MNSIKQIDAGQLNVGYVEAGSADGSAVILISLASDSGRFRSRLADQPAGSTA
jgi:hypothetical protein